MKDTILHPDTKHELIVDASYTGSRIDKYIAEQFSLYSRSYFNKLIESGNVALNGKTVDKSSTPIKTGDHIIITIPPKKVIDPELLSKKAPTIDVIFEHEHFLIIYKPAGLLVHPPAVAIQEATLVDWLIHMYNELTSVGYADRPGIVHRLDKDTSGLLIIPRTNFAHTVFGNLFRERKINKTYYAIVHGHPPAKGIIEKYIGRDPITKTKMIATDSPLPHTKMRDAQTHYRVVEYYDDHSLVEVKPVTGRTHQIRVHLATIGYPIVGDSVYGTKSKLINRQALHAAKIAFEFGDKKYSFVKDIPEDMQQLIKNLRRNG